MPKQKTASKVDFGIKSDIHHLEKRIQANLRRFEGEFSPEFYKLVLKYCDAMTLDSVSNAVKDKHLTCLLTLSRLLETKWEKATKADIQKLVIKFMSKYSKTGQETHTTQDFKKVVKIFVRWLKTGERRKNSDKVDPQEIRWIRINRVKDQIAREDLITEDELTRMIHACGGSLRDRALIATHYDAGSRAGEVLTLQIKHVVFDQNGAMIKVSGKTGARPIRIIRSSIHLRAWINSHPFKDNLEAPLWINQSKHKYGQQLSYAGANRTLKEIAQRAGITKRIYFHLFRHSQVTKTSSFMTEAQQKIRYGWSSSSKMPGRYSHLTISDIDDALLSHYGIKTDEVKPKEAQKCPFCEEINSANEEYCNSCHKPLDIRAAYEMETNEHKEIKNLQDQLKELKDNLPQIIAQAIQRAKGDLVQEKWSVA
jgi:integrase